jgi:hypothetical protein
MLCIFMRLLAPRVRRASGSVGRRTSSGGGLSALQFSQVGFDVCAESE